MRRHRLTLASIVILTVGAVALVVFALSTRGYPVQHVALNDGGIWVTSSRDQLFGRLNKPAGSLDAAMNPVSGGLSTSTLDTRQAGAAVVAWDQGAGNLYPVDVTRATIAKDHAAATASGQQVELAGGTLAVLDPVTGEVRAERVDTATSITDLTGVDHAAKPVARIDVAGGGSSKKAQDGMAVGVDGTIYAVSSSGRAISVAPSPTGFQPPQSSQLGVRLTSVQVTAIGTQLVVLDAAAGSLVLPGGKTVHLNGNTAGASLQSPSPDSPAVVVATVTTLLSIDIGSGHATVLFDKANGSPAQPTWLGDCVYAAWAGTPGVYEHSCSGAAATPGNVKDVKDLSQPVFRVNRDSDRPQ